MNKDAWYQYFTERKAVADQNAEAIKAGYFTIWIDTGSVTHKNIKLEDCGITPVELNSYPVRPDQA